MRLTHEYDVLGWAEVRGILDASTPAKQMLKCVSEVGELADAVAAMDYNEIVDGIGDTLVTLILLCELVEQASGSEEVLTLDKCLTHAFGVIQHRTGKLINGVFVKDAGQ